MEKEKFSNIMILIPSIVLSLIAFVTAFLLAAMSPYMLAELETKYIIPFAAGLEQAIIGLFFSELFITIGILGIKSTKSKLLDEMGISLVVAFIILQVLFFNEILSQFGKVDAGETERLLYSLTFIISVISLKYSLTTAV